MSNNNTAAIEREKRHMGLKASARISQMKLMITRIT